MREVEGLEPGAPIRVADEDGNSLGWGLVEPEGAIAVRMVSPDEELTWDESEVDRRVEAAVAMRDRRLSDAIAQSRRLVHGEGDGLPGVAVDQLGDYLLVYKYSRAAEAFLEDLVASLERVVKPTGIYMQDRLRPVTPDDKRPPAFHMAGKIAPPEIQVQEDGLEFIVDVTAPVSPGLFLDLREGRRWVEDFARDKRILNLFSFTGSFGVRAARAGAKEIVNVDAAPRAHARCRQNLAASGFDPEACVHKVGDVFKHLEKLRQRDEHFDLVVVDPPPFSRVKGKVFSALKDWRELMSAIARIVAPEGEVLAVSNASKLTEDELLAALGEGARYGGRDARLIGERGLPEDFPVPPAFSEGRYLQIKRLFLP